MTDGSYDCQCPRGWQKIGYPPKCLDIDECVLYNPCLVGYCVNTKGSYSCKCPKVFQFDTAAGHCVNPPCSPGEGLYECSCPPSYNNTLGGCVDVDECAASTYPCVTGNYVNSEGSYSCVCPKGFFFFDQKFCKDRNECVEFLCDLCPGGSTASTHRETIDAPVQLILTESMEDVPDVSEAKCSNTCEYVRCEPWSLHVLTVLMGRFAHVQWHALPRRRVWSFETAVKKLTAVCNVQVVASAFKITCVCRPGIEGSPPLRQCGMGVNFKAVEIKALRHDFGKSCIPDGMENDLTKGICISMTRCSAFLFRNPKLKIEKVQN
ncbi:latent-transforming growth factor beta-binding protein 4-like [Paramacrobiotus metropolitanus]|uniref:latent-transforming growth factor beta-binding protein 4-like n=1 Tax=Paramacrobiotus metropolitanus TaxID=2943436 RepID=UPI002445DFC2|nr:latent-transforming growth factor beta-binding protein 4-like [Paramacrobiotus metropolitanus]